MNVHRVFPMVETTQIGDARRAAVQMAERVGFDETACGRVALVVTELGTNLVRHADRGRLLVAARPGPERPVVEVLSIDEGPGMSALEVCMRDGYSTGGTAGTGLGAVRRLSDGFDGYSASPGGTVLLARLHAQPRRAGGISDGSGYCYGAVSIAAPGETVSGDAWSIAVDGPRASVLVVDGLGHGPLAHEAASAVARAFDDGPWADPASTLGRAHVAAQPTRGAAGAVAVLDAQRGSVRFCGVGNIVGRLLSAVEERTLLSQHGTLGLQTRTLSAVDLPWPSHALLVLHSDGMATRWSLAKTPDLLMRDPGVIAGWLLREHARGRDDATVVVVRHRPN